MYKKFIAILILFVFCLITLTTPSKTLAQNVADAIRTLTSEMAQRADKVRLIPFAMTKNEAASLLKTNANPQKKFIASYVLWRSLCIEKRSTMTSSCTPEEIQSQPANERLAIENIMGLHNRLGQWVMGLSSKVKADILGTKLPDFEFVAGHFLQENVSCNLELARKVVAAESDMGDVPFFTLNSTHTIALLSIVDDERKRKLISLLKKLKPANYIDSIRFLSLQVHRDSKLIEELFQQVQKQPSINQVFFKAKGQGVPAVDPLLLHSASVCIASGGMEYLNILEGERIKPKIENLYAYLRDHDLLKKKLSETERKNAIAAALDFSWQLRVNDFEYFKHGKKEIFKIKMLTSEVEIDTFSHVRLFKAPKNLIQSVVSQRNIEAPLVPVPKNRGELKLFPNNLDRVSSEIYRPTQQFTLIVEGKNTQFNKYGRIGSLLIFFEGTKKPDGAIELNSGQNMTSEDDERKSPYKAEVNCSDRECLNKKIVITENSSAKRVQLQCKINKITLVSAGGELLKQKELEKERQVFANLKSPGVIDICQTENGKLFYFIEMSSTSQSGKVSFTAAGRVGTAVILKFEYGNLDGSGSAGGYGDQSKIEYEPKSGIFKLTSDLSDPSKIILTFKVQ